LSGGTGEFYFSSIATNGVDVHDVSSEKLGAGGVFEKVAPGDWIDTESLLLWPDVDGPSQKTEAITIGFRLLERDDDAVAKKILDGLSKASKAVLEAYTQNEAAKKGHEAIIDLASLFIGVYAAHDVAIGSLVGLSGPFDNYQAGRFLRVRGHQNSFAVLSVVPDTNPSSNFGIMLR
jgi:hypothetical protein